MIFVEAYFPPPFPKTPPIPNLILWIFIGLFIKLESILKTLTIPRVGFFAIYVKSARDVRRRVLRRNILLRGGGWMKAVIIGDKLMETST